MSLGDRAVHVEAQTGIDFGRDTPRHDVENLEAEGDGQLVQGDADALAGVGRFLFGVGECLFDQRRVFGHLNGLEEEAGIGGGVTGLIFADAVEIAGIGDDDTGLFKLA